MKAVVMAGGEGTRLRPLTSNQPKPMVSIVGRPCMEHIVQLLRDHGIDRGAAVRSERSQRAGRVVGAVVVDRGAQLGDARRCCGWVMAHRSDAPKPATYRV